VSDHFPAENGLLERECASANGSVSCSQWQWHYHETFMSLVPIARHHSCMEPLAWGIVLYETSILKSYGTFLYEK